MNPQYSYEKLVSAAGYVLATMRPGRYIPHSVLVDACAALASRPDVERVSHVIALQKWTLLLNNDEEVGKVVRR